MFESFWHKQHAPDRAAFYSVKVSHTSFLHMWHCYYAHTWKLSIHSAV